MVNPLNPRGHGNPVPPANAQMSAGGPKSNAKKIQPMKMSGGGPTPQHTQTPLRTPAADQELHRLQTQLNDERKRVTNELGSKHTIDQDGLMRELFEVSDDLGRAGQALGDVGTGVKLIMEKLNQIFHKRGIRPVVPKVNVLFDPTSQEAVEVRPSDAVPNRTVLGVRRVGYANGSRVLRTAQVIVSKLPDPPPTN